MFKFSETTACVREAAEPLAAGARWAPDRFEPNNSERWSSSMSASADRGVLSCERAEALWSGGYGGFFLSAGAGAVWFGSLGVDSRGADGG